MPSLHDASILGNLIGGPGAVESFDVPYLFETYPARDDLHPVDPDDALWLAGETAEAPAPPAHTDLAWLIDEAESLGDGQGDPLGARAVCCGAACDLVHSLRFWGHESALSYLNDPRTPVKRSDLDRLHAFTVHRSPLAAELVAVAAWYLHLDSTVSSLLARAVLRIAAEAEDFGSRDCGDYEATEAAFRAAAIESMMEASAGEGF